ncbi:MAG: acetoin utilization protein AcuC [Candidatus Brockarchaeota archaeon]|nr:acetoin utilization protein AcuC [Candidatus Brockarchaeota archaeon]
MDSEKKVLGLVYGNELLSYSFGPNHVMNSKRMEAFFRAIESEGLLSNDKILLIRPRMATVDEIMLYHDGKYVEFVREMSIEGIGLLDHGDTPAFPGVFEAASYVVGSTLAAFETLMKHEIKYAMNPMGGLHHARRGRAAGFCVFNDIGVLIEKARKEYGLRRILYVDLDAHHGDGVMYDYYEDPDLYIVDFHENGRYLYPGTGFENETGRGAAVGTKLNLVLRPGASDYEFEEKMDKAKQFISQKSFELTILQAGVDSISEDPITHLNLSAYSHLSMLSFLKELSSKSIIGPLIILGGGGYNLNNIAEVWTKIVKALIGS